MRILSTLCVLLCTLALSAQGPSIKFGKIASSDLQTKVYDIDSSASAVVLSDVGSTEIVGNNKGWFSLVYKQHRRVHILNKNGYDEADVEIPLYTSGNMEEELQQVKAVTYNLVDGKVVETKLEKDNIFKEKRSKNLVIKKFTLPNVKEGSIIEYEYRVNSDFLFNLQPWAFQGSAPRLWSEYRLSLPEFLGYIFLTQGYQGYELRDQKSRQGQYIVRDATGAGATESGRLDCGVTDYRWAMKNVPELKEESYTTTLRNHISKIEFQLSEFRYPLTHRQIMGSWQGLARDLLKDEDFGSALDKNNGWLSDIVKEAAGGATTDLQKAKNIFAYVRDNFTCTNHNARYLQQTLKNLIKTRNGNVSEINLLLVAMLRNAGLESEPIMLSTRSHGYVYSLYPLLDRFNYVVANVTVDGKTHLLDASRERLGFGRLAPDCYNGHARVINEAATPLELVADSVRESKLTSIFITQDNKGGWIGNMKQTPGYFESWHIRNKLKESGKDAFFKQVQKDFNSEISIEEPAVDSLTRYEDPVTIRYNFTMEKSDEDIIYLNPMFGEGYKQNPFKSQSRLYPVEMPATSDETFLLTFFIPEGYKVDELPKSVRARLNEEDATMFEYLISHSGNTISLRSRLKVDRSYYTPDEYEMLREFFNLIVTKHNEQIVLKKAK